MTEERAHYGPDPGPIRETCYLPFCDPGYTHPTPDEVRSLTRRLGMSGSEVANFTGMSNGRTVRKWIAPTDSANARSIPYAAWRLLVLRHHKGNEALLV